MTDRRIINQFTRYERAMNLLATSFCNPLEEKHLGNLITAEEKSLLKYPEYDLFIAEEGRLLYIFGLPNLNICARKLRNLFPMGHTRYSSNVLEIINLFNDYAKEFLFNNEIKFRYSHIKLAHTNEDPFEDVSFAIKIEDNTYARFMYKKMYCLGKCTEKQFFEEVDKIDKTISDKIENAFLMFFVHFDSFKESMYKLGDLKYKEDFISLAKKGGHDFSIIFMETPWYDRPRYGS